MAMLRAPYNDRDHVKGPARAAVTLVEYGDYQCPYCGQAYWVLKDIEDRFRNDLRFIFRHFPLTEVHPFAMVAAEAAEAADAQGKFWEMHDTLYENQDALDLDSILEYAASLDLDTEAVRADIESHRHLPKIQEDFMGGVRSGVNGTPCFFINGVRHDGPWDAASLSRAIASSRRDSAYAR
jgi:protein-disulfide isomerase